MEYKFFEDKQIITLNQIPTSIYDKLLSIGGVDVRDNHTTITFCGIILTEKLTYCFLPAASKSQLESQNIHLVANLIKVINAYSRSVNTSLLVHDENEQDEIIDDISLITIMEILDLFFNIGILQSRNLVPSDKGRTNWSKTINQNFPLITANNIPIYIDLIRYPISTYQDDVISSIHCEIILELFKKFPWLDDRFPFLSESQLIERIIPIALNIDQRIFLLKQRLHVTFVSLEIRTLNLMIDFLENKKKNGSNEVVIGIRKFHFVWEFLLKNIFTDVDYRINSDLPIPQYHYLDSNKKPYNSAEKGMRIDLFIKQEDSCWIVDSKYYLAVNPQTAPGWPDLVKQFFYVKAIRLLYPKIQVDDIRNVFIFPGRYKVLSKIQMTYRQDNQKGDEFEQLLDDFFPIDCLYLDPNDVMEYFINTEKVNIKDLLFTEDVN